MSLRHRRAVSIAAAVAVLAGAGGVAAQFTTSTTSAPQKIGTGTVALSLDSVAPLTWTDEIANLAAGDSVERFVDLRNAGSIDISGIDATQTNTLGSLLSEPSDINVRLVICSVAWSVTDGTCSGRSADALDTSSVREWAGQNKPLNGFGAFAAGDVAHLKVVTTLVPGATNTVQGKTGTITYTFTGAQRDAADAQVAPSAPIIPIGTDEYSVEYADFTESGSIQVYFLDHNGDRAKYSLRYNTAEGQTKTVDIPISARTYDESFGAYLYSYLLPNQTRDFEHTISIITSVGQQTSVRTATVSADLSGVGNFRIDTSATKAQMTWDKSGVPTDSYEIAYYERDPDFSNTAPVRVKKIITVPANQTSFELTGLKQNTAYMATITRILGKYRSYDQYQHFTTTRDYDSTVLADHPIGYYKLDDAAGSSQWKNSGAGLSAATAVGTVGSGAPVVAVNEQPAGTKSATLGSGAYLTLPSDQTSFTQNFTVEAWVNPSTLDAQMGIMEKYGPNTGNHGYGLRMNQGGWTSFFIQNETGLHAAFGANLVANQPNHIAGGVDAQGRVWISVNGLRTYGEGSGHVAAVDNSPLRIGARGSDGAFSFQGSIDNVAIYDHQIEDRSFLEESGYPYSQSFAYWRFVDGL